MELYLGRSKELLLRVATQLSINKPWMLDDKSKADEIVQRAVNLIEAVNRMADKIDNAAKVLNEQNDKNT